MKLPHLEAPLALWVALKLRLWGRVQGEVPFLAAAFRLLIIG